MYGKVAVLTYAKGISQFLMYKATGRIPTDSSGSDSDSDAEEGLGARIASGLTNAKEGIADHFEEAKTRFLSLFQKNL